MPPQPAFKRPVLQRPSQVKRWRRNGHVSAAPRASLGPDVVAGVRQITPQDGRDLILSGSSTLTSTVLEQGLADEVVLIVSPELKAPCAILHRPSESNSRCHAERRRGEFRSL